MSEGIAVNQVDLKQLFMPKWSSTVKRMKSSKLDILTTPAGFLLHWFCFNQSCHSLYICVPSRFIYWNPNSKLDGIRRWEWSTHESDSCPYNRDSTELPNLFHHRTILGEVWHPAAGPPHTPWHPDPASRTMRNKIVIYKLPSLCKFVVIA